MQPSLEQINKLVSFYKDVDGNWQINHVMGHVNGQLLGNVRGNIWGTVLGNIHGEFWGKVLKSEKASIK
jgi:hypothetical protein